MSLRIGAGLALVPWTAAALAGTTSTHLSVTATVVDRCSIRTSADQAAGNEILSISCTRHISPEVTLPPRLAKAPAALGTDPLVITVTF